MVMMLVAVFGQIADPLGDLPDVTHQVGID